MKICQEFNETVMNKIAENLRMMWGPQSFAAGGCSGGGGGGAVGEQTRMSAKFLCWNQDAKQRQLCI